MTIATDIGDLKPHIKPGWVAMDKNGRWCWYKHKPHINESKEMWLRDEIEHPWCDLGCLDIEPVEDWRKSLIRIETPIEKAIRQQYEDSVNRVIELAEWAESPSIKDLF